MVATTERELLTFEEAASLLQVDRSTIEQLVESGTLPSVAVPTTLVRVKRQDVEALGENQAVRTDVVPYVGLRYVTSVEELRRKLSAEEVRARVAAVYAARADRERLLAERGNIPFPPSWELVRETRDERQFRAVICADASVIAKWLIPEPFSDEVESLIARTLAMGESLVAPPILPFEISNILRKQVVRRSMPIVEAESRLARFDTLPLSIVQPPTLHRDALIYADQYGLPAIYDACYLVVAQSLGCDFWTDDQRLLRTLDGRLPFVRWIGDYAMPDQLQPDV